MDKLFNELDEDIENKENIKKKTDIIKYLLSKGNYSKNKYYTKKLKEYKKKYL